MTKDTIEIWFLISSFTQVWPTYDHRPSHTQEGSTIYSAHLTERDCQQQLKRLREPTTVSTMVGIVKQIHITKRCEKSEANLTW